ncbi:hypothetical protein [Nitrosomonas sp.]|nr:hypothetical protein [Nitrosomonas sp.]
MKRNRFPGAPVGPAQGHARIHGHAGRSHSTIVFLLPALPAKRF